MEISKTDLVRIIREELAKARKRDLHVLNENAGGVHAGKPPEEIANWYIAKWDKLRKDMSIALPGQGDHWVKEIATDAIEQIKHEPEIAEEYYPHLTEEDLGVLVTILEEYLLYMQRGGR